MKTVIQLTEVELTTWSIIMTRADRLGISYLKSTEKIGSFCTIADK